MALNIGGILGSVGGIIGQTNTTQNPIVSGLGSALQLAGQIIPVATQRAPATTALVPAMATATPVAVTGVGTRGLTQEIFNAGQKLLARLGVPYRATTGSFTAALKRSLSAVAGLARRTPAGTMVGLLTGLGLSAYESTLLTAWQVQRRKHRRMNPANSKALRRSIRRVKAFHRLCAEADIIKPRKRCAPVRACA